LQGQSQLYFKKVLWDKIFLKLYLIFDILPKQGGVPNNESKESTLSYLDFGFIKGFG